MDWSTIYNDPSSRIILIALVYVAISSISSWNNKRRLKSKIDSYKFDRLFVVRRGLLGMFFSGGRGSFRVLGFKEGSIYMASSAREVTKSPDEIVKIEVTKEGGVESTLRLIPKQESFFSARLSIYMNVLEEVDPVTKNKIPSTDVRADIMTIIKQLDIELVEV